MAVFRIHKSKDYTVMSNHHLKNKELSLKAKGLLTLMLSLPDDWDYSVLGLTSLSRDGKDAIMSTLDELVKHCYLSMTMSRDNMGHITGWNYDVYETPQSEKSDSGKPYAENPNTGNPAQLNINNINTNKQSTNNIIEDNSSRIINNTSKNISSSIKEKRKKGIDLSFVGSSFIDTMERYISYRKELKKPLVQSSAESAYRNLLKLSNQDARIADEIVEQSISNGWTGLFELKQTTQYGSNNNQTSRNPWCDAADAITSAGGIL